MSLGKHTRSTVEMKSIVNAFVDELQASEKGEPTSLGFIKHELPRDGNVDAHELFQVMCVGGSNLQVSKMMAKEHLNPISLAVEALPTLNTKKDLFSFLLEFLDPSVRVVALNFAYPMEPKTKYGVLDGKLLTGTKEHLLTDLIDTYVGEEFSRFIEKALGKKIKVAVANDTVCLTLAGLEKAKPKSLVAMILGTGNNTGMFSDESTVINLESGNFNQFELSEPGQAIDKGSNNPGKQWLEKEVAGAYIYKHFNYYAEHYGIASKVTSTQEVNDMAINGLPIEQLIAQHVVRESAKLVACLLAGFVQYKQAAIDVVVEGGFYRNGYKYDDLVKHYLDVLDVRPKAVNIFYVENSSIMGAAHLVLPLT